MSKAKSKTAKSVPFVGKVYSLNVHGTDNADSSIEVAAVLRQGSDFVAVRAGAGNGSRPLIEWSALILSAYLDKRTVGGRNRDILVTYAFSPVTKANEIQNVVFPYLKPKRR